ncbi:MAG: glycosyltransferase [Polaribacter sp.]
MIATPKKIIIAPLNWGLGHASRCVPIIHALLKNNFIPILASDGQALTFLKQEFPDLEILELPSYNISYGKNIHLKLLLQFPKIYKAVKKEKQVIQQFIDKNKDVVGIVSDNRFGVRSNKLPSVYTTHQLKILAGFFTPLASFIHQQIIKNFDECWVPDQEKSLLSGKLSSTNKKLNQKYIGVLSRFKKEELEINIAILIILSGPEPNRTFLEKKLITEFKNDKRNIVFVLGKVENQQKKWKKKNITFHNYLLSKELQNLINSSEIVVCRSGYSSIMDLAVLQKKVFLIPTKNQPEQEYLALLLEKKRLAPFSKTEDFTKEKLAKLINYKGLKIDKTVLSSDLFRLFKSK